MKIKLYTEQQIDMVINVIKETTTSYTIRTPEDVLDEFKEILNTLEDDGYEVATVEVKL